MNSLKDMGSFNSQPLALKTTQFFFIFVPAGASVGHSAGPSAGLSDLNRLEL